MSDSYPVTVAVRRADGSVEHVRVGTAVRAGDGFRLTLGELAIGATPDAAGASPWGGGGAGGGGGARRSAPPPAADGGMVFPPYGRSKGQPIAGATRQDLEFYANGCRRTLADPGKSRWHDKERVLLAAIEAELARQSGGGADDEPGFGFGGGGGTRDDEEPPPRGDEDIPF